MRVNGINASPPLRDGAVRDGISGVKMVEIEMLIEIFLTDVPVVVELPEDDADAASRVVCDAGGTIDIDEGTVEGTYLEIYGEATISAQGYTLRREILIARGGCESITTASGAVA